MQRPWVNYHHLLYFKTIALEGGIANAAKKLRLGQPTLSTQLKQFEETLGHQLFDRSKRQLQLTEAGRLVLGYANEIFRMGDEMVDSLNDHHVAEKIQVQFGVADTIPKHIALKLFNEAQSRKDCIVSVSSGRDDELLRELRAHRLDLVVANNHPPVGETSGFFSKNIAKMPVVVCGTKRFARLQKDFPASLEGQPFVMPSFQTKLRSDVDHFLKLNDLNVDVVAEVHDTGVQKLIATHNEALVPVALPAVEELIASKELVLIGALEGVTEDLWFVATQRRIQNPIAAAIMKEFKI